MTENYRRMAQSDLRRVARAARKLEKTTSELREELREAIMRARDSGETYRSIAEAAGLSHPRIIQIVREGEKEAER